MFCSSVESALVCCFALFCCLFAVADFIISLWHFSDALEKPPNIIRKVTAKHVLDSSVIHIHMLGMFNCGIFARKNMRFNSILAHLYFSGCGNVASDYHLPRLVILSKPSRVYTTGEACPYQILSSCARCWTEMRSGSAPPVSCPAGRPQRPLSAFMTMPEPYSLSVPVTGAYEHCSA